MTGCHLSRNAPRAMPYKGRWVGETMAGGLKKRKKILFTEEAKKSNTPF